MFLFRHTVNLIGNVAKIDGPGERLNTGTAVSHLWSRVHVATNTSCVVEWVVCRVVDNWNTVLAERLYDYHGY
jgi:hypothetical protein